MNSKWLTVFGVGNAVFLGIVFMYKSCMVLGLPDAIGCLCAILVLSVCAGCLAQRIEDKQKLERKIV